MVNYYLYIKTHNITGLKYLGQTRQNPFTYLGSGVRWTRHLKKHGTDIKTEIIGEFSSLKELKAVALFYSELWDIKNSPYWANLVEESGSGGDLRSGKIHTEESKQKMKIAHTGKKLTEEHKRKISQSCAGHIAHNKGKSMSEEQRRKISESCKNAENSGKFKKGYKHTEEAKAEMSKSRKGREPWNKGRKGFCHTEETKLKISMARRNQLVL